METSREIANADTERMNDFLEREGSFFSVVIQKDARKETKKDGPVSSAETNDSDVLVCGICDVFPFSVRRK